MTGRPKKREPPTTAGEWEIYQMDQLKSDAARALYGALCRDLETAGTLNSATRSLARDAAAQEDVIVAAMVDIRKRGAVEVLEQGAQKLRVENRYLRAKLRAEARKQAIMEALGLLPARRGPGRPPKQAQEPADDTGALDAAWADFDSGGDGDGADTSP